TASLLACGLSLAYADDLQTNLQQEAIGIQNQYGLHAIAISAYIPNGTKINVFNGSMTKSADQAINTNSQFPIGGITRTFTAALILQLEQQGKININDPLGKYITVYPNWSNITLKQLLNHTSGIYSYDEIAHWWFHLAFHPNQVWTLKQLTDIAYANQAYFEPGQGWRFTGTDYVLLGMVIEKVTGQSVGDLLAQQFIKPLNLTHTYYSTQPYTDAQLAQIVHGYYSWHDLTDINGSWIGPAGALVSTPQDLLSWDVALFTGKVLNSGQLNEMLQFNSVKTGQPLQSLTETGYGLGMARVNTPIGNIYFAPGITPGYRSGLSYSPCTGLAVTFSLDSSLMDHPEVMGDILIHTYQTLLNDSKVQKAVAQYQRSNKLPAFCKLPKATGFDFPVIS
ncbi:MAG: (Serine-type) D-alanyl-D-alanine carboxypeptidase, partial [Gammaproteobacteria bacterium]|nr:(Serine-type) D-alanyl-D-alanine carboxypeptidase [Gammaproteobacteria bacterium]